MNTARIVPLLLPDGPRELGCSSGQEWLCRDCIELWTDHTRISSERIVMNLHKVKILRYYQVYILYIIYILTPDGRLCVVSSSKSL